MCNFIMESTYNIISRFLNNLLSSPSVRNSNVMFLNKSKGSVRLSIYKPELLYPGNPWT